jgi:uncharacterized membrane protein
MSPNGARSSAPRGTFELLRQLARLLLGVVVAAYLAYPFAVHWLIGAGQPRPALWLSAAALAGLCWSLPQSRWRWIGITLIAALLLVSSVAQLDMLVVFMPPIVVNLGLAGFFASTLARGREPLISLFARLERGSLPTELSVYTRRLTWIWVIFFVVMAALSLALAVTGVRIAWVWFTAAGNYLCVAALFVGEYAYRCTRFSHYRHASPFKLLRIMRGAMRELH